MNDTNRKRTAPSSTTQRTPTKRSASRGSARSSAAASTKKPTQRKVATSSARRAQAGQRGGASSRRAASTATPRTRSAQTLNGKAASASRGRTATAYQMSLTDRILSSRPAMIAIVVVIALLLIGIFDAVANGGKAYGNVSINGIDVGGMTSEEIQTTLKERYGSNVSHAQITVYANESAAQTDEDDLSDEERRALAEQISTEEAVATIGSWQTDALALKASLPAERVAEEALSYGRSDGGLLARMGLAFGRHDIDLSVDFDDDALEQLASDIDRTIGDPRVDTTVEIEDGTARAVEGHSGTLVDRNWLEGMISNAMMYEDVSDSFVAIATDAQSRISLDEAQSAAEAINRAISPGAYFNYQGRNWRIDAATLGEWTAVQVAEEGDGYRLDVSIDPTVAVPGVVAGAGTLMTSNDVTVTFENTGDGVIAHTQGAGSIPEVNAAVAALNDALYGAEGAAWNGGATEAANITITESERPESLTFDQALELGVITVVGEFTTEFSTQEGTENRNHNIKLAADILNDGIVSANGGQWDFNDRSGNTNEEAGFWEAGSIIDGEYVDSVGGGICQVATTIFNAAYEAGLPIVERHNHSLYIASYPTGRDAAVDYPAMTLIFQNDFSSDLLLKMSYTDGTVTARLYGVYTGYTVSTETGDWQEGAEYGTRFEVDDSIGKSSYYKKTVGADGSSVSIVRTVRDARGDTVSVDEFHSNYNPKDEIYVVGSEVDTSELRRK